MIDLRIAQLRVLAAQNGRRLVARARTRSGSFATAAVEEVDYHGRARPTGDMGRVVRHGPVGEDQEAPASPITNSRRNDEPALGAKCAQRMHDVEPHRGDVNKFWLGPFQSLCKLCHDSGKRLVEQRGYRPDIKLDGWPLDPRHPVYRAR